MHVHVRKHNTRTQDRRQYAEGVERFIIPLTISAFGVFFRRAMCGRHKTAISTTANTTLCEEKKSATWLQTKEIIKNKLFNVLAHLHECNMCNLLTCFLVFVYMC